MFAIGDKEWPGLSKLMEEAGEVVQVGGKLMGTHGATNHWDGTSLRERLFEEMADLQAAIEFVQSHNMTIKERLAFFRRVADKRDLFERWHAGEQQQLPIILCKDE